MSESKEPETTEIESDPKLPVEEVVEVTDPYTQVSIYKDVREADLSSDDVEPGLFETSGTSKEIKECIEMLDTIPDEDIENGLSKDEITCIGVNYESSNRAPVDDIRVKGINEKPFVNKIMYGNKKLGVKSTNVNAKGKLTTTDAIAKFTNNLSLGKHTLATLWHSGFSLLISPPKESEILNFQYAVAKAEYKLGYDTNNFVYSNYGVAINKLFVDFVMNHVIASSLKLPEGESYLDYIKVTDLDTLAIAMATCIRPGGYTLTTTCKNTLKIVNKRPVCDFTATAEVIPENMLWVNRNILTPEAVAIISKTTPGSQTLDEVITYQSMIKANDEKIVKLADDQDREVTFNLQTPTIRKYVDSGTMWVNNVIKEAEALFTEKDDTEVKNNKIDIMVSSSVLNKYNSYINSIHLDDAYVDEEGAIQAVLEVLTSSGKVSSKLLDAILNYIDNNYVSIVAKYNFNCPVCQEAGRDTSQFDSDIKGFKEFMPINAVEHFFALSALMFTQITTRKK